MKLSVDQDACIMCEACVPTCPTEMVRSKGDFIKIGRVACIECGHCISVCPTGAIIDGDEATREPVPEGFASPDDLTRLIRARRTVREYRPDPVPRETLERILDAARWVPTAANAQTQEYVVVADPAARDELKRMIEDYYRDFADALADRANREQRLLGLGLDPVAATHPHFLAAIPAFVKAVDAGRDRLFFGAPVVLAIHSARDAVTPEATCYHATFAISLLAEAHGLGSCIIGYAYDALQNRPDFREWLGVPEWNNVYSVMVLGWPAETFRLVPGRKAVDAVWK